MLSKEVVVSESFLLKDTMTSETEHVIVTKMGTGNLVFCVYFNVLLSWLPCLSLVEL